MGRTPLFAANWKMHLSADDVDRYLADFGTGLDSIEARAQSPLEVAFYPSALWLERLTAATLGRGRKNVSVVIGGQDLHPLASGAHTGDISAEQLASAGCTSVLCGHSERRQDHGEDDQLVAAKTVAALRAGLQPIVCVGESLEEREGGQTESVLERQLGTVLQTVLEASRPAARDERGSRGRRNGRDVSPLLGGRVRAHLGDRDRQDGNSTARARGSRRDSARAPAGGRRGAGCCDPRSLRRLRQAGQLRGALRREGRRRFPHRRRES